MNTNLPTTTGTKTSIKREARRTTKFLQTTLLSALFFLLLGVGESWGQVATTYSFVQTTGTYADITGGTLLGTATANAIGTTSLDDNVYAVTGLPFTFTYNGVGYTSFNINSNGYITFGATAPAGNVYIPISSVTAYAGAVSAWGRDLNALFNIGGRTGTLRWETVGTAPNREVVIQWKNFRLAYSTSTTIAPYLDFQIRLKETSNGIDIIYGPSGMAIGTSTSTTTSYTAQVGLRGPDNTFATNVLNRTNTTGSINSSTAGTTNSSTQSTTLGSFSSNGTPGRHTNGKIYRYTPIVVVACSGTPAPGNTISSSATVAPGGTVNLSLQNATSGTGLTYAWESGSSSTGPWTVFGTSAATQTSPAINASTWFRCRVICGANTGASNPVQVTLSYCTASGTGANTSITNFVTTGGVTNISNASGFSAGGYGNYTAVSCSQTAGGTINFTLTYGSDPGTRIFVDWNNDLDFADANETVYSSNAYVASSVSGSFVVPAGQAAGSYRMRIVADWNATAPIACPVSINGEIEDYTFTVAAAPSCSSLPTSLSASSITSSSATISWTAPASAPGSGYEIYYSTSSTAPVSGTAATTTTAAGIVTKSITGLTANTTYYYWVRSNCNGTDKGSWAAGTAFTTPCVAITSFPWLETFSSTSTTLGCWSAINGNADGAAWEVSSLYPQDLSGRHLSLYTDYNTSNQDYAVTPQLNLGTTPKLLKFYVRDYSTAEPDNLKVKISTTGSSISEFTTELLNLSTTQINTTYVQYTVDLSSYSGNVYLAFAREDSPADGWYLYIDEVTVLNKPIITTSGTLTAFSSCSGSASTAQSFTVSGSNLTADLVVTAPTGFEVSKTETGTYTSSVSYTPSSGTVSSQTVWVRLSTSASGTYSSSNVALTSTGATTVNVAVSGTVLSISAAPAITGPICPGSTTVSGTGVAGSTIKVIRSGSEIQSGSATWSGNTWSISVSTVNAGESLTATQTESGKCISASSAAYVVITPAAWGNIQWPTSQPQTICGTPVIFYGQVFKSGVTEAAGQGASLTADLGWSSTNTNPNTWTNWTAATFNAQQGNNDEFQANLGAGLTEGTWYYAYRYSYAGCPIYAGYGGVYGSGGSNGTATVPASHTASLTSGAGSDSQTKCKGTAITSITYTLGNGGTNATLTSGSFPTGISASVSGGVLTISGTPTVAGVYSYTFATSGSSNCAYTFTGSITVNETLNWANTQSPASGSICSSGTYTIYGQVYQPGITDAAGQGAGITAEFGYSTSNSDPSSVSGWTWASATYNSTSSGNNDEYLGTFSGLSAGTYYYAFRYKITASASCGYQYGGYNGGFWNGTSNVNGVLTVNSLPSITTQPSTPSATCSGNGTQTISVTATGTGLTYQWRKAGVNLTNTGVVSGSSTATLTLTNPTNSAAASYDCVVSGTCSPAVTSNAVTVSVNDALSGLTISPTSATICNGSIQSLVASGGTLPYVNTQDFTISGTPVGWTLTPGTGMSVDVNASANAGGSANELRFAYTGTGPSTTAIATMPVINASALSSLSISFNSFIDNYDATTYPYSIKVQISTNNSTWTDAWTLTPTGTANVTSTPSVSLSALNNSSTAYVRFVFIGNTFGIDNWYVDNISITGNQENSIVWSTTTALYTNAAATTAYTGTTARTVYAKPTTTTTYTATATSAAGCTSSNTVEVTVNALPTATISAGSATTFCSGGSVVLTASAGSSYVWKKDGVAISLATAQTYTAATSGAYTVTVTNSNSCSATSAATTVTVNALPGSATSSNVTLCGTGSVTLTATDPGAGYTINWFNAAQDTQLATASLTYTTLSISTTTTYYAEMENTTTGCKSENRTAVQAIVNVTNTFTDTSGDHKWFNTANWSCGTLPNATTNVVIPTAKTVSVYYNVNGAPAYANTIVLEGTANVTVTSDHSINVTNKVTVASGSSFTVQNNASLVQTDNVANEGNIIVQKSTPSNRLLKRNDAVLWSSPVVQNLQAISTGTPDAYFMEHNPQANSWSAVSNPASANFTKGKGFLVRTPSTFPTTATQQWSVDFTGVPNNGNVTLSAGSTGATEKYLLVGNPYPSAISIAAFRAANQNITGVFYFYRKPNGVTSISGYGTLAANGQFSTNDAENLVGALTPGDVIASGQGFFVAMKSDNNNGEVYFTNAMRVANDHGHFNRVNTNLDSYKLIVKTPVGGNSQMIMNYDSETTNGYDVGYDAVAFTDGTTDFSSIMANEKYRIQSKGEYNAADVIPVQFKTGAAGEHRIKLQDAQGVFAADQMVIIKDNLTGVQHNLTANGDYVFTATAGTFTNRFEVIYQQAYYTALQANSCGATIANMNSLVYADLVNGATGYRFKVVNNTTAAVQTIDRPQHWFAFNMLSAYDYNTPYTISVQVQKDGVWTGYYGATCTVNSPNIAATGVMQINPSQCGMTLPTIGTVIATTPVAGATGYKFRITNTTANAMGNNLVQEVTRTNHWFTLAMLTRYNYGSSYAIEVAVKTTAGYTPYGNACTVYAPAVPTLATCGQTVATATTLVRTTATTLATQYRFQVTRIATQETITFDTANYWFSFRVNVPGYAAGEQYGVRVAVMTAGAWSPYGDACDITAPIATARTTEEAAPSEANLFKPVAYPNPFASTFGISLATPSADVIHLMVYDLQGRLIEKQNVFVSQLDSLQIGTNYPSGDYLLVVAQGANIKSSHIHKD